MTATTTPPAPPDQTGHGLSRRQVAAVMIGLMLAMFLAALDQMIITSALRTIADELNGLTMQAWATTAYLITSVISTPLYGKLSDIYGRKPLYLTAISLFIVGSVLSGLAQSMYQLAAFRAVQGLGAGGLFSLALAILADLFPPQERARYQAYLTSVFGVASVAGPVIGGFFAGMDTLLGLSGWWWGFLINLPIGLIALVVVWRAFHLPHRRTPQRVDYAGAVALTLSLVPLLLAAERGREWGWASTRTVLMFTVGAVGLLAFLLAERRMGDAALLPPRLFRSRTFSLVNLVSFVTGTAVLGVMILLPLYLQIVKGLSPTAAGLMLLPQVAAILIAGRIAGPIVARTNRYKGILLLGVVMMTAATFGFSALRVDTSLWWTGLAAAGLGFGIGLFFQVVLAALQAGVPPEDMGVASGLFSFFRQIGGTVGIAVTMSVMFSVVGGRLSNALREAQSTPEFQAALQDPAVTADPASRPVLEGVRDGGAHIDLNDSSYLSDIDDRLARPVLEGMNSAMSTAYLVIATVMLVAIVLTFAIRQSPADRS